MQNTTFTCDNCGITANTPAGRIGWFDVNAVVNAPTGPRYLVLNFHAVSCLSEFIELKKYEPMLLDPTQLPNP
jgi:hypothetical protein